MKVGKHLCKVTAPSNGWIGEAGNKNTPFIRIPLVVMEGPCEGEETVFQAWISDSALEATIKSLSEAFGWNGDLARLAKQVTDGPFVGKLCRLTCEEEEYNGKKSVKNKWLNSAEGAAKMMDQTRADALAARLDARSRAAALTAEKKPAKTADPDLDAEADDFLR